MADAEKAASKRRYPRRSFKRVISVLYQGKYFVGKGKDIGEGGILIEVPLELPENSIMVVNFLLSEKILSVRSEVRSIYSKDDKNRYGLYFLNLSYEGKKAIREYIAAKSDEESKEDLFQSRMAAL